MKKREKYILVACFLMMLLNMFWILKYHVPDKGFLTAFISLKNFIWSSVTSIGRIFITVEGLRDIINITSPKNITYNFSIGDPNYTIELNVSANFVVDSWWYDLIDLKHGVTINTGVFFTPNTTINAVRWSNKLLVYANNSLGVIANENVSFFVFIPNSAPLIEYIAPEIFVCEGSYLSYFFNVTDVDESAPSASINPTGPQSPFYVVYSKNINLTTNRYEIFSGNLGKAHAGGTNAGYKIYEENVSVDDGQYADSRQTNITVIEINNAPSIIDIGVQTIWTQGVNSTFYYQVNVSDVEDGNQDSGNLVFNLTIRNSTGAIVNLFNISQNGVMNFTANLTDIGVYNISVCITDRGIANPHQNISLCGQDGSNITSCNNFSLTVTTQNRPPEITSNYPVNLTLIVNEGQSLYFNITMYDPDGTAPDTYWYLDSSLDKFLSGVIGGGNFDEFLQFFDYDSAGYHNLTAEITDGLLNASLTWNITVINVELPPEIPPGGGGGGAVTPLCIEKWGCGYWGFCQDAETALKTGTLSGENYRMVKETCKINGWKNENCGFQIRECLDVHYCNTTLKKPLEVQGCYYTKKANCYDGIKNCHDGACEVLVDCGGPCMPCPTCSDGIQNQGEEGIDCGGPCPPCPSEKPLGRSLFRYFLILIIILLVLFIVIKLLKRPKLKDIEK